MELYYTPNSPYARISRVAARMSGLVDQITEIEAKTRDVNTSYFEIAPLARVPMLQDGETRLADTRDICAYFDQKAGRKQWFPDETVETTYMRHIAFGFLDGVAVWLRENARPVGQSSEPVLAYETFRAGQVLTWLEVQWTAPATVDFTALTIACTLDIAIDRGMDVDWSANAPTILNWVQRFAHEPDMQSTRPLPN